MSKLNPDVVDRASEVVRPLLHLEPPEAIHVLSTALAALLIREETPKLRESLLMAHVAVTRRIVEILASKGVVRAETEH